jgi:hypothetical protein
VRRIHQSLTATDPDGTTYRVDEPELLLWVHCGEVASIADIARRCGMPSGVADVALAFAMLPGWARQMYGKPGGPLTDMAATAGLRAARLAFRQQKLFTAAMRAVHRAEWAGEKEPFSPG